MVGQKLEIRGGELYFLKFEALAKYNENYYYFFKDNFQQIGL